jgi:SAM-dependent methyltransferase
MDRRSKFGGDRVSQDFPPEFDPKIYRSIHNDLWMLNDVELLAHYEAIGKAAGRRANVFRGRQDFAGLFDASYEILEIGPYNRPLVRGPNVRYFDVLDRMGLARQLRGAELRLLDQIPEIDFVSPTGDLDIVPGVFDAVVSSHVIEHQPDLVGHLNKVAARLRPHGYYLLCIPDKRYCYDRFHPESSLAEVIQAAVERRVFHTLGTVLTQCVRGAHNTPRLHWQGEHGVQRKPTTGQYAAARAEFDRARASNTYIDRHAWQFTPDSFRYLLERIWALRWISFHVLRVYPTIWGASDFWVVLERGDHLTSVPSVAGF